MTNVLAGSANFPPNLFDSNELFMEGHGRKRAQAEASINTARCDVVTQRRGQTLFLREHCLLWCEWRSRV